MMAHNIQFKKDFDKLPESVSSMFGRPAYTSHYKCSSEFTAWKTNYTFKDILRIYSTCNLKPFAWYKYSNVPGHFI